MAFIPWAQQVQGAKFGEEPKKDETGWTWPWQPEHWAKVSKESGAPAFEEPLLRGLWTGGLTALGLLTPAKVLGMGGLAGQLATKPGVPGAIAKMAGAATKIPSWMAALGGAGAGYTYGQTPTGGTPTAEPGQYANIPGEPGWFDIAQVGGNASNLPQPGEAGAGATTEPYKIDIDGTQIWYNPTGGVYGEGGWDLVPRATGLSAEEQIRQAELDRLAAMERLKASQGGQLTGDQQAAFEQQRLEWEKEKLRLQQEHEMRAIQLQSELQRKMQEAAAAQEMAQMYAADPYKYWAQLGGGTPEAVARLTGGKVGAGQPFQQGVPLSIPSSQWWGNLLPSEQQQISGGLNWLGVNPQDWFSMYQRMAPGLASRQVEPAWAR
uniref:Uncharacterized protein n=1 Tax=viral metagenome TaxID=1070528 RepID=A0A6H1Z6U4_9ZZZZ